MAREEYAGGAVTTTLASGIGTSDTSFTIADATGWPTGATGKFVVTLGRNTATQEKVLCTTRSGTTVTGVTRGHDGTSAQSHSAGAVAEHTISAAKIDDLDDHVYDTGRDNHTQYLNTTRHNALDHSTALNTAVLANLNDVAATAPATNDMLAWNGTAWAPAAASAGLLAAISYTAGTAYNIATDTLTDVDATNLAITFTVPASGKVLVRLTGSCAAAGSATYQWGLREATAEVGSTQPVINNASASATSFQRLTATFLITGLTPGASKTYKWAHRSSTGTSTLGATVNTMEVAAVP